MPVRVLREEGRALVSALSERPQAKEEALPLQQSAVRQQLALQLVWRLQGAQWR